MLDALTALVIAAGPIVFTTGTDEPQAVALVDLPARCAVCPPGRLTCAYYPRFMVREVDLGGVGAEVIAVVPLPPKRRPPACKPGRQTSEVSLTGAADAWSGYFEGARGRFAFLRREEARAGAMGFTVYDTETDQRVLTDEAIGPIRVTGKGDRVGISYVRRSVAPCSPLTGGEPCWIQIRTALGVVDPPPDCASAYREANESAARAACVGDARSAERCMEAELRLRPAVPPFVPPALTYEVEIPDLEAPSTRTQGSKVVGCRPSD